MKFRPCIDLHQGRVKQIVGSTLSDADPSSLKENFVSDKPPAWYADLFRAHNMTGGHIIMLGPGNEDAALEACGTWPGGMQLGGGINSANAKYWLEKGAAAVIVTSWVFRDGRTDWQRLDELMSITGRERLVLDLSCRKKDDRYFIVTDRWQKFTEETVCRETLEKLAEYSFEFLIHAADVEGKCRGIDPELVSLLADISPVPTTYAGGASSVDDLYLVKKLGKGRIDLTIGSALDIFGGSGVTFEQVARFNRDEA
jgi:phosphoribosylformimino-5-aminoimidazole carboxamide ribotide isomerase